MKYRNPTQTKRRIRSIACVAALAGSAPLAAFADFVRPPAVPPGIVVSADHKAFLKAHALGTQNYICLPSESGFAWTFFGPQATLFSRNDQQVATHFLSPNPEEDGEPRATWQHSRDSSTVWAKILRPSDDPAFVAPGAIPWLLLKRMGSQDGPTGGNKLTPTTYIQRINTSGGVEPATGCSGPADVGKKALVPYEADYVFYYKPAESRY